MVRKLIARRKLHGGGGGTFECDEVAKRRAPQDSALKVVDKLLDVSIVCATKIVKVVLLPSGRAHASERSKGYLPAQPAAHQSKRRGCR